jgi:hypothetical protein
MAVLLAIPMTGCSKRYDASDYTQAILDVTYKNEIVLYSEITGEDEEDANAIFQKNVDVAMEGIATLELPENLEDEYRKLFEDLLKNVRYTISESVKGEDGTYLVDVKVQPLTIFEDTYSDFVEAATEYAQSISNEVMNGQEMPTEEEMRNHTYELYYEIMNAQLKSGLHYADEETITLHITKEKRNVYQIAEDDMALLDETMLSKNVLN